MKTLYKKELCSCFYTMTGYVFIAAFVLSTALFFAVNNVLMNSDSLSSVLLSNCYVMILIVPPLTMRLFAEERKSRTEQIWLNAPIRIEEVILAKYLAAVTVLCIALVVSLVFPIILSFIGTGFFIGEAVIGYIGCGMVGLALIAMGMFLSTLFENQLSCAIATAVAILALYLADSVGVGIGIPAVRNLLCAITPYYPLRLFRIGLLLPSSLAQLLSFSLVFILLTLLSIDARLNKCSRIPFKGKHPA